MPLVKTSSMVYGDIDGHEILLCIMKTSEVIKKLQSLDLSKYPLNDIISLIHNFENIKIIRLTISPGAIITRLRKGWGYMERAELSYPPVKNCTVCQRATLPNQTMFYGTISDSDTPTIDNRAIGLSECSTLARKGKISKGIEYFTVSTWCLTKAIQVVAIVDDVAFENVRNNRMLDLAKTKFEECKLQPDFEEYARFVATEFSKPVDYDYDYLISAAIADAYINDVRFDGIAYPSVRIGGQAGMNIALAPKVADESLMLVRTAELTYYKNEAHGLCIVNRVSDIQTWSYSECQYPSDSEIAKLIHVETLDDLEK